MDQELLKKVFKPDMLFVRFWVFYQGKLFVSKNNKVLILSKKNSPKDSKKLNQVQQASTSQKLNNKILLQAKLNSQPQSPQTQPNPQPKPDLKKSFLNDLNKLQSEMKEHLKKIMGNYRSQASIDYNYIQKVLHEIEGIYVDIMANKDKNSNFARDILNIQNILYKNNKIMLHNNKFLNKLNRLQSEMKEYTKKIKHKKNIEYKEIMNIANEIENIYNKIMDSINTQNIKNYKSLEELLKIIESI